jgi:hypothetical protein
MRPSAAPVRRRPSRRTDVLIAAAATLFFCWSFVPAWYRSPGGTIDGLGLPAVSLNAWDGPTAPAALLALVAAAWVGARAGRDLRDPQAVVAVDVALAMGALLLTLAGILVRRPGLVGPSEPAWGLAVAAAIAAVWTIAAGRGLRETRASHLYHP